MTFFRKKIPFSRPEFLTTSFLVIDHVFQIFIFRIFTVWNVICNPFFTRKTPISENNSLMTPFLLYSYFRAHPTTLLLKILGDGCIGRPPPQTLGGPSPNPPRYPPMRLLRKVAYSIWKIPKDIYGDIKGAEAIQKYLKKMKHSYLRSSG